MGQEKMINQSSKQHCAESYPKVYIKHQYRLWFIWCCYYPETVNHYWGWTPLNSFPSWDLKEQQWLAAGTQSVKTIPWHRRTAKGFLWMSSSHFNTAAYKVVPGGIILCFLSNSLVFSGRYLQGITVASMKCCFSQSSKTISSSSSLQLVGHYNAEDKQ